MLQQLETEKNECNIPTRRRSVRWT